MIECVPNVSEGRDRGTIDAIAAAIGGTPEVFLLNVSSDQDHNRTVFTYVSENGEALLAATMAMFDVAVPRIDLRQHRGAHPRVGAVDVVPFVPLRGSEMRECVTLAEKAGEAIADRHGIPVYLYEHAARAEHRRELPGIRSGGFEKFGEKIADPKWAPDFGPSEVHPTAGVSIVGARIPLVAFNVQLGTDRIDIAEKIARSVRGVSGGLRFVRALPIQLAHRGVVQVSMNLLDFRRTPIHRAFVLVREEAARYGVEVISSEIVGLVPAEALYGTAEWFLRIENFRPDLVLERRISELVKQ
jgi:glutamate formiminotransferase